jgi:hypothetical protein
VTARSISPASCPLTAVNSTPSDSATELNRGKVRNPCGEGGIPKDGHRDFKPELYPQKHGQEDQDRVQRDPHDVGSPTPALPYGLLAHGEFSLA